MRSTKDSIKKVFVALGYGSSVSEYSGKTVAEVLKEGAVKMGAAPSKSSIKATTTSEVLDYIADNYGDEENEPYDLEVTKTNCTISVTRNGEEVTPGDDVLFNGDVLTIRETANENYSVKSLKVNDVEKVPEAIISRGNIPSYMTTVVVSGKVEIEAAGEFKKFDLAFNDTNATITVTRNGESVSEGNYTVKYNDELTISAEADDGYEITSFKVNGEDFVSGSTHTVTENVYVEVVAELISQE